MDELTIDEKTYISSKRAASVTGYAKDYVGQLCREGRVEAKLVGRSWYVYEPSLNKHRYEKQDVEDPTVEEAPLEASTTEESEWAKQSEPSEKTNIQAVWETPTYKAEEAVELPEFKEEESVYEAQEASSASVEEIESAWKDWFSEDAATPSAIEPIELSETENEPTEEVSVPIIRAIEEKPPLREVVPMDIPKRRYVPEHITRCEAPKTPRNNSPRPAKSRTVILRAVLIAVILLVSAVALIGTGIGNTLTGKSSTNLPFIDFLEGRDSIKQNK